MSKTLTECPNCQGAWGFEEIQFQECWSCGYPNSHVEDESPLQYEDYDSSFDDDFEPNRQDILYH